MPLLAATGLAKSYGGVRVLDAVDFTVERGEVHALLGENGAGKSTLVKILAGAVRPDSGRVELEGSPLPSGDPLGVRRRGLSIVYQEFTLVPELSVADNVFLGRERGGLFLRRSEMLRAVQPVLDDLGVGIAASAPVRTLSVAHQQIVEIARALLGDAKVLIFDEPSASLSGREVDRLLAILRRLRERGLGIVYISHRFEEIFALADRLTVLRDGRRVATEAVAGVDRRQLIRWMVGRDVSEEFPSRRIDPGATVLEVRGLSAAPRFQDVSFSVRAGEVVGVAGLVGAGRSSTALAILGALPSRGEVRLNGRAVRFASPSDAIAHGVAYVTEDRKGRGMLATMSAAANLTLASLGQYTRAGWLLAPRESAAAAAAARDCDVRAASLEQPASTLSGGNQQKVLLARFLLTRPKLLILDEPTRGVDVGARAEIYGLMNRLCADGLAVVMISSDLPELLGMADRVIVMREGRVTGALDRASATPEAVMALATSSRSAA
ncbi:MAG TPA: sugar ABC transporter ATP-binding protein [Vicinamibacterales bacterium]|nr:sugar ABC transporter ATP-binding protein [Vicinamibacterales bacterium]